MDCFDSGDYHDKFSDFYSLHRTIDRGAFGQVVHATDKNSGEEIAVKILRKKTLKPGYIASLRKEAKIMASLDHPNIIQFKHLKETQTKIFLAMELFQGTNLQRYMDLNKIPAGRAQEITKQLLEGVEYLHSKSIIHRDLKPENVLVSEKDGILVKIIDFGLSTQLDQPQNMKTSKCGTLIFMAPEQKFSKCYSSSIDIWSCGIILYILCCNKHPLAEKEDTQSSYMKKLENPMWKFDDAFNSLAKSLFLKMTEITPVMRYTASQCLAHPWINDEKSKIPLTMLEEMNLYADQVKLKNILLSILFASQVSPIRVPEILPFKVAESPEPKKKPEPPKIFINPPRRKRNSFDTNSGVSFTVRQRVLKNTQISITPRPKKIKFYK